MRNSCVPIATSFLFLAMCIFVLYIDPNRNYPSSVIEVALEPNKSMKLTFPERAEGYLDIARNVFPFSHTFIKGMSPGLGLVVAGIKMTADVIFPIPEQNSTTEYLITNEANYTVNTTIDLVNSPSPYEREHFYGWIYLGIIAGNVFVNIVMMCFARQPDVKVTMYKKPSQYDGCEKCKGCLFCLCCYRKKTKDEKKAKSTTLKAVPMTTIEYERQRIAQMQRASMSVAKV